LDLLYHRAQSKSAALSFYIDPGGSRLCQQNRTCTLPLCTPDSITELNNVSLLTVDSSPGKPARANKLIDERDLHWRFFRDDRDRPHRQSQSRDKRI